VQNPLTKGGVPAANDTGRRCSGWLTLGQVTISSNPTKPSLRGSLSVSGFDLIVSDAVPGLWTVEGTTNLTDWSPLLVTNTSTSDWSVTDEESIAARFYRVVGSQ
jgi:hypothetical protein